jgi:hypothetical protein
MSQEVGDLFYTYLLSIPKKDLIDVNDSNAIPITEEKMYVQRLNNKSHENFLEFIIDYRQFNEDKLKNTDNKTNVNGYFLEIHNMEQLLNDKIQATDFYDIYCNWCTRNNEKNKITMHKFGGLMQTYMGKNKSDNVYYLLNTINKSMVHVEYQRGVYINIKSSEQIETNKSEITETEQKNIVDSLPASSE